MNHDQLATQIAGKRSSYRPSKQTLSHIAGKTLVMLIGPTGIGKSSIIEHVVSQEPSYERVTIVTTRNRKPEDPVGHLTADEGIDYQTILRMIEKGELIEFSINTNGHVYSQTAAGFPGTVNLMALLPSGVEPLRHVGFGRTISCYIVAEATSWKEWLSSSRSSYHDLEARLDEAITSIDYALEHRDDPLFFLNQPGQLDDTAASIIASIEGTPRSLSGIEATNYLVAMKKVVIDLKASL